MLKNRSIGVRLIIGFGLMIGYYDGWQSCLAISVVPVPLQTLIVRTMFECLPLWHQSQAQASLLRMLSDVRGYLALGQPEFRVSNYEESRAVHLRPIWPN
jgi:hypothetical protein